VIVRGIIHIVGFGFKKEMPDLATGHGHKPGDKRGRHRVDKQQHIAKQE